MLFTRFNPSLLSACAYINGKQGIIISITTWSSHGRAEYRVASSPGSRIGQKQQRGRVEEKEVNAHTFRYRLESLGMRLSIEQTTLGEGTLSSTAKKRSYTREEKLKVVRGQESATLSATTSKACGTILLCSKMETAYLSWLFPVSVQSISCSPNRRVLIDL